MELLRAVPMEVIPVVLAAFIAGSLCPTYYAQERFRGFGRAMVSRLPYVAPPAMSEEEALEAAVENAACERDGEQNGET